MYWWWIVMKNIEYVIKKQHEFKNSFSSSRQMFSAKIPEDPQWLHQHHWETTLWTIQGSLQQKPSNSRLQTLDKKKTYLFFLKEDISVPNFCFVPFMENFSALNLTFVDDWPALLVSILKKYLSIWIIFDKFYFTFVLWAWIQTVTVSRWKCFFKKR